MDVGLGVWIDSAARYYPLETIRSEGNLVRDTLAGRGLLIYFAPNAAAPSAMYSTSTAARWSGDTLRLDGGETILAGVLRDASGARRRAERPMQLFTRWYGFALMFPATTVYERSPR